MKRQTPYQTKTSELRLSLMAPPNSRKRSGVGLRGKEVRELDTYKPKHFTFAPRTARTDGTSEGWFDKREEARSGSARSTVEEATQSEHSSVTERGRQRKS